MLVEGKVWKFGRDVDTDVIIPARYLTTHDPAVLGKHCLETLDPKFPERVEPGDVIVAEDNFGCGSSREHAPLAIKGAGVPVVIAKSFARIFFRNAINNGLAVLEAPEAVDGLKTGDRIRVDLQKGEIMDLSTETTFQATPLPDFIQEIIDAGGLINYLIERTGSGGKVDGERIKG